MEIIITVRLYTEIDGWQEEFTLLPVVSCGCGSDTNLQDSSLNNLWAV